MGGVGNSSNMTMSITQSMLNWSYAQNTHTEDTSLKGDASEHTPFRVAFLIYAGLGVLCCGMCSWLSKTRARRYEEFNDSLDTRTLGSICRT